jgi:GDP-L-fucose synthase
MRMIGDKFSGSINLATGHSISIRDTVDVIKNVAGCKSETMWDSSKPDGQRFRAYDVTKLSSIGFKPAYSFEAAVAETYAWYAANVASVRR